jgi:hypothetical protein
MFPPCFFKIPVERFLESVGKNQSGHPPTGISEKPGSFWGGKKSLLVGSARYKHALYPYKGETYATGNAMYDMLPECV